MMVILNSVWSDISLKLEYYLMPYTKINSKWIKDLNVRWDTIKLLKEDMSRALFDVDHSKIFLDPSHNGNKNKNKQMGPN